MNIEACVIHCTATRENQPFNDVSITAMHKAKGYGSVMGYGVLIGIKGERWRGRPDGTLGAHVKGFNHRTVSRCYVGGLDAVTGKPKDTRTEAQNAALLDECRKLIKVYPDIVFLGHRDLSPDKDKDGIIEPYEFLKSCPCFSVSQWAKANGLPAGRFDWKGSWLGTQGVMGGSFRKV